MLEYLHIFYHYQYFNRNPIQILTASPDGWERSWSLLFRLPELFGVSELSKSSATIRKDKVQKSLKRSRQFTFTFKMQVTTTWLVSMTPNVWVPWISMTFHRMHLNWRPHHLPHILPAPFSQKLCWLKVWKDSLHQFMINSSRKSPQRPVNKTTNHRNPWEFATNFPEFLDESSPKNPVGLRGGEPLHQGSRVRQLRSQGVQGQGAEVASDGNSGNSLPFFGTE